MGDSPRACAACGRHSGQFFARWYQARLSKGAVRCRSPVDPGQYARRESFSRGTAPPPMGWEGLAHWYWIGTDGKAGDIHIDTHTHTLTHEEREGGQEGYREDTQTRVHVDTHSPVRSPEYSGARLGRG